MGLTKNEEKIGVAREEFLRKADAEISDLYKNAKEKLKSVAE